MFRHRGDAMMRVSRRSWRRTIVPSNLHHVLDHLIVMNLAHSLGPRENRTAPRAGGDAWNSSSPLQAIARYALGDADTAYLRAGLVIGLWSACFLPAGRRAFRPLQWVVRAIEIMRVLPILIRCSCSITRAELGIRLVPDTVGVSSGSKRRRFAEIFRSGLTPSGDNRGCPHGRAANGRSSAIKLRRCGSCHAGDGNQSSSYQESAVIRSAPLQN